MAHLLGEKPALLEPLRLPGAGLAPQEPGAEKQLTLHILRLFAPEPHRESTVSQQAQHLVSFKK